MEITMRFDYYSCNVYIPDGYIKNLDEVYKQFFEWIYDQPECWVEIGKNMLLSYDEDNFVQYINETVLADSKEKAYIISDKKKSKKKHRILDFY